MTSARHLLLPCLLPAAIVTPAQADEYDAFNYTAAVNLVQDNNLFRVPGSLKPQSDTITNSLVGASFNRRFSLQQVSANVSVANIHYASHSYLDADVLNYDGRWLWAVGSHLTGELAASRAEAPNSYAETPEIRTSGQRNLRVTEAQSFKLDYSLHPSWHVIGDVGHQRLRNEQVIFAEGDTEATGAGIGLKYSPATGSWFSWQARQYDGRYTRRPFDPVSRFDNKFTQPGQAFDLGWQLSGHSAINGHLEYMHRRHEHFSERNFSGWAGQLGYAYQYSAKTSFNLAYVRSLAAYQDAASSYYVSDGVNLGSRWAATEKITVGAHVGYSQRQYRGEVAPLAGARRRDDGTDGGIDLTYRASRWLEIKAGLVAERRNSNLNGFDFTDRKILLSAAAYF